MSKRLLEYDPVTGLTEYFHKTEKGFAIETVQDVEGVIEHNKKALNNDNGHYRHGNFHPVAAIPHIVIEQWRKELGDDPLAKRNRKWLIAKLNDSDNKFLRLKGGRL